MILEVNDIYTWYGLSQVLFGVSLKVNEGEVVSILGRNGVGKTTTLRSIMGLTPLARVGLGGTPEYRWSPWFPQGLVSWAHFSTPRWHFVVGRLTIDAVVAFPATWPDLPGGLRPRICAARGPRAMQRLPGFTFP